MKRVLVTTIISLIIFVSFPYVSVLADLPELSENENAYVIEGSSKSTIINQNSDKELKMGDITDLLVCKVSLDTLQGKLSDSIKLTKEDIKSLNSDETGIFTENQALTYQDLLNILLLTSDDNASKLLGINIGKKLSGNDETDNAEALNIFIEKLNETSKELKLSKTNFSDVTGEKNTTVPTDLAVLTQTVLEDKTVASIINSNSYELKVKQEDLKQNTDQQKSLDESANIEDEKTITIENRNSYILSTVNSSSETNFSAENEDSVSLKEDSVNEETNQSTEQTDNSVDKSDETDNSNDQTEKSNNETSKNTNEEIQKASVLNVEQINTNEVDRSQNPKANTIGYFSNLNSEEACGVFLTGIDKAQISSVLANVSDEEIANQISSVISELERNYGFVDLSENEVITSQYNLENAHFTSPKSISLCGIDSLNAYMPATEAELKTKVIWNEDYVKPTGEKYQLNQSIEPLTQIATLEIENGEQTQSIPLYNTDKVTIRNWTDSFLKYGLISIVVIVFLLVIWRLIYVHNRRKVLRRKRQRRLQRQRQMRAKQLAIQQGRNQSR